MIKSNILLLMVDEERYPVVYETEEVKLWRAENFKAQNFLKSNGFEFCNHYAGSCACAPSRATLYTGQYPSLHGVSQTPGAAKNDFESDMFWLSPDTVPTFGDYLRFGGYSTYWKGKWHASQADIIQPGPGFNPYPSYDSNTGIPIPKAEERYLKADKLNDFGFDAWIGPEPFGRLPENSGSSSKNIVNGRDVIFANEAIELLKNLSSKPPLEQEPWCIMTSLVNPHDITLYGEITKLSNDFNFMIDPSAPYIPKAPTSNETLADKPRCQDSYKQVYQKAFQPTINSLEYRQFYYSLQLEADRQMWRVIQALINSNFYENTLIIFTSDHGDLGGSHGNLFQKWYQAYEETIHVPLLFHYPKWFQGYHHTHQLTSHVDILPTLLSIAGINPNEAFHELSKSHTQVFPLVGKDLTPILKGKKTPDKPIYFMTDDNVTKGQNQKTFAGHTYESVIQPSSVETVVVYLKNEYTGQSEKWKFSNYFDNELLWTTPQSQDKNIVSTNTLCCLEIDNYDITTCAGCSQYEMYNLNIDPIEQHNLMNHYHTNCELRHKADELFSILLEQRRLKRLAPRGN